VRQKVEVIITVGIQATEMAAKVTRTIPIVQWPGGDIVDAGLAASNARPGGNVTGFVLFDAELNAKRLELLRATFPERRRVAIVALRDTPAAVLERLQKDARAFDVELSEIIAERPSDFAAAIATSSQRVEGVIVPANAILFQHRASIVAAARAAKLPGIYPERAYVTAGGLMAYAPIIDELYRRLGNTVVKLLDGADPASLPIEGPTNFVLVVNQQTAREIGVAVPPSLLARADEVIE
jgi:putative ABC transport system substrate-binding protein